MLTASPRCTPGAPLVVPSVPTLPPWPVVSSVLAHRRLGMHRYGISVFKFTAVLQKERGGRVRRRSLLFCSPAPPGRTLVCPNYPQDELTYGTRRMAVAARLLRFRGHEGLLFWVRSTHLITTIASAPNRYPGPTDLPGSACIC